MRREVRRCPSMTALARNCGALRFDATWLRQGLLKGVQFLVISRTKSVFPKPAGKVYYAISRPNVRARMKTALPPR